MYKRYQGCGGDLNHLVLVFMFFLLIFIYSFATVFVSRVGFHYICINGIKERNAFVVCVKYSVGYFHCSSFTVPRSFGPFSTAVQSLIVLLITGLPPPRTLTATVMCGILFSLGKPTTRTATTLSPIPI